MLGLCIYHLFSRCCLPKILSDMAPDKRGYQENIFSYFPLKMFVVGTHYKYVYLEK